MADRENSETVDKAIRAVFEKNSAEICSLYQEHVPGYLSSLREAAEAQDDELVSYRSHKMCSAMKTVGFSEPASLLEQIERTSPDHNSLMSMIDRIENLVNRSIIVLEKRSPGV